jgi:pimeloyl-ACP methyl ester carboxylesterase
MTDADPQAGYAPVNGLEMYYQIHGTGQPLILLHGGGGAIEMFGEVLPLLAEGRQEDWEEPKGRAADARGAIADFSS